MADSSRLLVLYATQTGNAQVKLDLCAGSKLRMSCASREERRRSVQATLA